MPTRRRAAQRRGHDARQLPAAAAVRNKPELWEALEKIKDILDHIVKLPLLGLFDRKFKWAELNRYPSQLLLALDDSLRTRLLDAPIDQIDHLREPIRVLFGHRYPHLRQRRQPTSQGRRQPLGGDYVDLAIKSFLTGATWDDFPDSLPPATNKFRGSHGDTLTTGRVHQSEEILAATEPAGPPEGLSRTEHIHLPGSEPEAIVEAGMADIDTGPAPSSGLCHNVGGFSINMPAARAPHGGVTYDGDVEMAEDPGTTTASDLPSETEATLGQGCHDHGKEKDSDAKPDAGARPSDQIPPTPLITVNGLLSWSMPTPQQLERLFNGLDQARIGQLKADMEGRSGFRDVVLELLFTHRLRLSDFGPDGTEEEALQKLRAMYQAAWANLSTRRRAEGKNQSQATTTSTRGHVGAPPGKRDKRVDKYLDLYRQKLLAEDRVRELKHMASRRGPDHLGLRQAQAKLAQILHDLADLVDDIRVARTSDPRWRHDYKRVKAIFMPRSPRPGDPDPPEPAGLLLGVPTEDWEYWTWADMTNLPVDNDEITKYITDLPLAADSDEDTVGVPEYHDELVPRHPNFLRDTLLRHGLASTDDVKMFEYKGWRIDPPAMQLIRIRNFLSDEDIDRTLNWPVKFAEIQEYLNHLLNAWKGEPWGADLRRAIGMLHAHRIFQTHCYGFPELDVAALSRPENQLTFRRDRLAVRPGAGTIRTVSVRRTARQNAAAGVSTGARNIVHWPVGSVFDAGLRIRPDTLRDVVVPAFAEEMKQCWAIYTRGKSPATFPSLVYGENSGNSYGNCRGQFDMSLGSSRVKDVVNADREGKYCPHEHNGPLVFFRGFRRAVLQNVLNDTPDPESFVAERNRRLLVPPQPTRAAREYPFATLDLPAVPRDPAKHNVDPFRWTAFYHEMKRNEAAAAATSRVQIERAQLRAEQDSLARARAHAHQGAVFLPVPEVPANFNGPRPVERRAAGDAVLQDALRRLRRLAVRLDIAQEMAPRSALGLVCEYVVAGLSRPAPQPGARATTTEDVPWAEAEAAYPSLDPGEEEWLRFLAGPSAHTAAIRNPIHPGNWELLSAADRVQEILDDISPLSPLRSEASGRVTVEEFANMVNAGGKGPVRRREYTIDQVKEMCHRLYEHGRIRYLNDGDDLNEWLVARPRCDLHPEDRIVWTQPERSPGAQQERLDSPQPPPSPADLQSYEALAARPTSRESSARTIRFFSNLGYRLGRQLERLGQDVPRSLHLRQGDVAAMRRDPGLRTQLDSLWEGSKKVGELWTQQVGTATSDTAQEFTMASTPATYEQVALLADARALHDSRAAPPGIDLGTFVHRHLVPAFGAYEAWQDNPAVFRPSPEDVDAEQRARELVRIALIKEASTNGNMIRRDRRFLNRYKGRTSDDLRVRDPVWSWAGPGAATWDEVRAERPPFFSLDRWPVGMQTPARQAEIRASGAGPQRRAAASQADEQQRSAEYQQKLTSQIKYVTFKDLPRDIPQAFGYGKPEYWAGDTKRQEKMLIENMTDLVGQAFVKPKTGWQAFVQRFSGGGRGRGVSASWVPEVQLPAISSKYIPKSRPRAAAPEADGGAMDVDEDVEMAEDEETDESGSEKDRNEDGPKMSVIGDPDEENW